MPQGMNYCSRHHSHQPPFPHLSPSVFSSILSLASPLRLLSPSSLPLKGPLYRSLHGQRALERQRGREGGREREREHCRCFALSFLIDESGPRGALKDNQYSFFPLFFSLSFFLTVRFVADSDKMGWQSRIRVWGGDTHPLITALWGVPEDWFIGVFLKMCSSACANQLLCVCVCVGRDETLGARKKQSCRENIELIQ